MINDKDSSNLDQETINKLSDPDNELVCTAAFYKNGKIKLFARDPANPEEIKNAEKIKKKYDEVTENAQQAGKSGLAVSKVNPWIFVYTIGGRTYEVVIHP
ncbi:MAG: hypothetical protein IPK63_03935 [Candidatus Competibacteraceae bacterium]|nr:hypothetical protein [Candidatus Competibacteraceae bacterium]